MTSTPLRLMQLFTALSAALLTACALLYAVDPPAVNGVVWIRAAGILALSFLSLRWAAQLRRGHRGAYRRLLWVSIAGSLGIAALALLPDSPFPLWFRLEQSAQGLVLLALAATLLRPSLRATLEPTR
ncbi:hypothetical protein [Dactylosporangium matsuzakiense]|nr:hypothetical protein [Dactylosporangium matsuzakiense]UWZ44528.1 hypothetical protein Dmats_45480 [Dactylosporangium matsuzakiense]